MFGNCTCPPAAAIGDIPDLDCGFDIRQVQKIIVARYKPDTFATLTTPTLLTNWTPLLTATDDTKHQVTPFVETFVIPAADAILEGGDDNTTVDGQPIVVGAAQIRATGLFAEIPGPLLVALKAFSCEANLMVYFINQDGNIFGQNPTGTKFTGTRVGSWFVGDAGNEGLNTRDKAPVGFNLRYGWRDKLIMIKPTDFDARFDL